jgi:hypothetical protein
MYERKGSDRAAIREGQQLRQGPAERQPQQCRALETYDHEKRLQALEDKRLEGPNPFQKAAEA